MPNTSTSIERQRALLQDNSTLQLPLLSRENWIRNKDRSHCYCCRRKFRPFVRKHHCRSCGDIVCSHCNRHRNVQTMPDGKILNVRLCVDCIDKSMRPHDPIDPIDPIASPTSPVSHRFHTINPTKSILDHVKTTSTVASSMAESVEYSIDEESDVCIFDDEDEGEEIEPMDRSTVVASDNASDMYERRRLDVLKSYCIMDSAPEPAYDALCELASRALGCTVAAVGFLGQHCQWYKARIGISQPALPRSVAFCAQLTYTTLPTIVLDASQDDRFQQNPLVTGSAHIRFYASTPICDATTGVVIGTVFAMDPEPKTELPSRAMEVLSYLSAAAERLVSAKKPKQRKRRVHSAPQLLHEADDGIEEVNQSIRASTPAMERPSKKYFLIDPSFLQETAKQQAPSLSTNAQTSQSSTKIIKTTSNELTKRHVNASVQAASQPESMCLDLLCRITDTQQILAQQQRVLLCTLTDHSQRISSLEKSVERIEDIVQKLQARSPGFRAPAPPLPPMQPERIELPVDEEFDL